MQNFRPATLPLGRREVSRLSSKIVLCFQTCVYSSLLTQRDVLCPSHEIMYLTMTAIYVRYIKQLMFVGILLLAFIKSTLEKDTGSNFIIFYS